MNSKISDALNSRFKPVALLWMDEVPSDAKLPPSKGHTCFVSMLVNTALNGTCSAFDSSRYGCATAARAIGFGDKAATGPMSQECLAHFLSYGNKNFDGTEDALKSLREAAERGELEKEFVEIFENGEGYKDSPRTASNFMRTQPMFKASAKYVVLKPVSQCRESDKPKVVIFLAEPHQLSALVTLASYDTPKVDRTTVVTGSGCQTVGHAYMESLLEEQRAIVGLTDIFARLVIKKQAGDDVLSFTVPWNMFVSMESNVENSFLSGPTWKRLIAES